MSWDENNNSTSTADLVSSGGIPHNVDRPVRIEGKNNDVDNSGIWVDIHEGGTTVIQEPSQSGETLTIKGNNSADTLAGTGARKVRVEYTNTALELKSFDIEMNGNSVVTTSITDFANVIDFYVVEVGSNGVATDDIEIVKATDNNVVYNVIKGGGNKSQCSLRHLLPASTFYLTGMLVSSSTRGAEVVLRSTCNDSGELIEDVFLYQVPLTVEDAPVYVNFNPAIVVAGGAKVKISARTTVNGKTKISTWLNGWVKI
ncbi:MAG: hypothetical protein GY928_37545 [Colwellia sp.]|nr:hypothetical protein [Colwellia sp.]